MISISSILSANHPTPELAEEVAREFMCVERKFPAQVFLPTASQAEYVKAIGTQAPDKRIFLMTSGNGSGKSTIVVNVVLNLVHGNINLHKYARDVQTNDEYHGFFNYEFFNNYPPNWPKVIWYVSNADSLDSIWLEFEKWAKPNSYIPSGKVARHEWYATVKFPKEGWTIHFKTVDQDAKTFESANVGIMIFDEPPPQSLYRAASSRLRAGGIILIPATPLLSASWFFDEIVNKVGIDGDKYWQKVSCWTNCVERAGEWDLDTWGIQKKGNLTESNIHFTLNQYDPDERPAREFGDFMYLSGVVYKTYHQTLKGIDYHFRNVNNDPMRSNDYLWRMIIDPHDRRPPSVIWVRYDKWMRRRVIREWPSIYDDCYNGLPFHKIKSADPYVVKDFVRMWIQIEEDLMIRPERMKTGVMDPNFGRKPNSVSGLMIYEEYQAEFRRQGRPRGFRTDVIDDLATGHKAVKNLLKPTADGDLMFAIDKSCYNTDYGMRNYQFKEWEGKIADEKEIREEVKEIGKDFADLVRYDIMSPISWEPSDHINMDPYEREDYLKKRTEFQKRVAKVLKRPKGAV